MKKISRDKGGEEEYDHLNLHVWIVNDTALDDLFFHHLVEENH